MDRQSRPTALASSFSGHNTTGLRHVGYVKIIVYQSPVAGIDDLRKGITDMIINMHADMPLRIWQKREY
jgi:hypothetical protein